MDYQNQPINNIQWIHCKHLIPNAYNPNFVAPMELDLLEVSILTDGWLFPVIVFDKKVHIPTLTNNKKKNKYTIIDGAHRTILIKDRKSIYQLTNGFIPCIVLNPSNPFATTVRMNRAKGTHAVMPMSDIVKQQLKNKTLKEIQKEFGMEKEEVVRLANSAGISHSELIGDDFANAWKPE